MYEQIRSLREDKDVSQQIIAELLDMRQTTYSRYESGVLEIPIQALIKLSKYYNVSVDYLLDLTDDRR